MRFTSLVVELIRARPRLVVWIVVLVQAGLWLFLPMLLYRSPPGDVATVLAYGREYQVGTWLGPPLAFWLADIAFRAAGNTMFGIYLLAQVCAGAETHIRRDLLHAQLRSLQQLARDVDAGAHDPLHGRVAGVVDEAARERARRHRRMPGQRLQSERLTEPAQRPLAGRGETLPQRFRHAARHVLRLPAAAVRRRDQPPGRVI
jgi:hypothetical protein